MIKVSGNHNISPATLNEMMVISAARALSNHDICFVGIGPPSAACNLARLTHAPEITLIYESGTIGSAPSILPLSIGDGELCASAITTVSVPELFRYWLQGGRITIGFLGAAQVDRFGNINTTVIGPYDRPSVRLPGGGGAPEIATSCHEIFITLKQSRRSLVEQIDFCTTFGHGEGGNARQALGLKTKGPTRLFTDLAVWQTNSDTKEFEVVSMHPGVTKTLIQDMCCWPVRFAKQAGETELPTKTEINVLRNLLAQTDTARKPRHHV